MTFEREGIKRALCRFRRDRRQSRYISLLNMDKATIICSLSSYFVAINSFNIVFHFAYPTIKPRYKKQRDFERIILP